MNPSTHMTGPEITPLRREAYLALRANILSEPDVHALHNLSPIPGGRWVYIIETPFATFPKFVLGTTDDDNVAPLLIAKAGRIESLDDLLATHIELAP